jgi:threonine/homoserine efflux transporter RhtA
VDLVSSSSRQNRFPQPGKQFVLQCRMRWVVPAARSTHAVWTGIGAAGTAIVGMIALDEPANATRIVAIGLIVAGAVSLQAVGSH